MPFVYKEINSSRNRLSSKNYIAYEFLKNMGNLNVEIPIHTPFSEATY